MPTAKRLRLAHFLDHNAHLYGVRILGRASFVLIAMSAAVLNHADRLARAKGLIPVHVEAHSMALGNHACMQPEPEYIQDEPILDEPAPDKPPCPRSKKGK
ncbi:MAG TPA: hypothetical protein PK156_02795 [Polyangium sp.]|nr:hypothetical protein [Polyangium sp.]